MHGSNETNNTRRVMAALRAHFSPRQMSTWFADTHVVQVDGDQVVIAVANSFKEQWMTRAFASSASAAVSSDFGRPMSVVFVAGKSTNGKAAPQEATAPAPPVTPTPAAGSARPSSPPPSPGLGAGDPPREPLFPAPPERPVLHPAYTLERFVVGPSNQVAYASACSAAEDPGGANNPVFFHGAAGLGKTHLLQAICHDVLRRRPDMRVRYVHCEQFTNEYVNAVQHNAHEAFRERYRTLDLLALDDVHFAGGKERTIQELFHTFNALHQRRAQIVLSSDVPPSEVAVTEQRLVSRFLWGLVVEIETPETETRMAITRAKAQALGLVFPNDVVEFVAQNIRSSVREIEGAVANIRTRALIEQRPVDLALARAALEPRLRQEPPQVTVQRVAEIVSAHYGVRVADLTAKGRTKSVSTPRQVAMYVARDISGRSLQEIGDFFGGRDHTTVLYAVERTAERMDRDDGFKATVHRLRDRVSRGG